MSKVFKEIFKYIANFTTRVYLTKYPLFILYNPNFHKIKGYEIREILSKIQPGDVLLRKYDGYLNNFFTPGYYSHAAIYIGENTIIHALGEGITKEDILQFCRADGICILRLKNITSEIISNAINIANEFLLTHIQYDYEFKDDDKELYCTELIDTCFNNILIDDVEEKAKRHIITPDSILDGPHFDKILEFRH